MYESILYQAVTNVIQSYCNYTAYGETGDDPSIDPVYPDPREGGYKGKSSLSSYIRNLKLTKQKASSNAVSTSQLT